MSQLSLNEIDYNYCRHFIKWVRIQLIKNESPKKPYQVALRLYFLFCSKSNRLSSASLSHIQDAF
jgi:hypothetical protein